MRFPRAAGILLHPTSLPGRFGIGDLGGEAYGFIDFLAATGQSLWQVMPLGPTGYGDSPYACFSAFAGNPLLISPETLAGEGLLSKQDLDSIPPFPQYHVDYGAVIGFKFALLKRAYEIFKSDATPAQNSEFEDFCGRNASWLNDFALFMALKQAHQSVWNNWERPLVKSQPDALKRASAELADSVSAHKFYQYLFFKQWGALKKYANERGIRIIGDIPIFVAYDSADVWAHPDLFYLDKDGKSSVVAGVPPDYFSKTGQLWGNPLYHWDVMAQQGYDWWIERFRINLVMLDIIRLDHFRGFEAYWEVPATEETAVNGRWVKGPGADFFRAINTALGDVPIIAEDLGVITPEVEALRDAFDFPGMKVLQFAFGEGTNNEYLPHNFTRNFVVYTGTHDNDTAIGWFRNSATEEERTFALKYLGTDGAEIHRDMIRLAFSSVAHTAIIPMQDILGLGSEARMNFPGKPSGNWGWRFTPDQITDEIRQYLADITEIYARKRLGEEKKREA